MSPNKQVEELNRDQQQQTNGGSIFGNDNSLSSLSISGAVNVHSSHTDDDGDTTSNNFGTNFGTGLLSTNNND